MLTGHFRLASVPCGFGCDRHVQKGCNLSDGRLVISLRMAERKLPSGHESAAYFDLGARMERKVPHSCKCCLHLMCQYMALNQINNMVEKQRIISILKYRSYVLPKNSSCNTYKNLTNTEFLT